MESVKRRSFLGVLAGGISAVVGGIMVVPLVRFAAWPLFHGSAGADWFSLGPASKFTGQAPVRAEVEVRKRDGWRVSVAKQTVYVVLVDNKPKVLSAICTHLGCVVPWDDKKSEFACPCHGAIYRRDGSSVSGPQPRGLDSLPTKIENDTLYVKYEYFRQLVAKREVIG